MHVDRYERYWMWAATGMLVLFLGAIVLTAVAGSAHPPSHVETVDPETLSVAGEFATPGVDGRTRWHASPWCSAPSSMSSVPMSCGCRRDGACGSASPARMSCTAFQIVGTNVNLTVAPGYVSEAVHTFAEPGEYLVVCNEYCGLGASPHAGPASSSEPPMTVATRLVLSHFWVAVDGLRRRLDDGRDAGAWRAPV